MVRARIHGEGNGIIASPWEKYWYQNAFQISSSWRVSNEPSHVFRRVWRKLRHTWKSLGSHIISVLEYWRLSNKSIRILQNFEQFYKSPKQVCYRRILKDFKVSWGNSKSHDQVLESSSRLEMSQTVLSSNFCICLCVCRGVNRSLGKRA